MMTVAIAHAATVLSMHFMDGHCPHVHVLKAQKFQPKTKKNLSNDAKQTGVDGIYLDPILVLSLFVFEDAKEDSSDK